MTALPPAWTRALGWLGWTGLATLTAVIYLFGDGAWPASTTIRACVVVAAGAAAGVAAAARIRVRPAWPYLAYAAALAIVWAATPSPDATRELARQVAFLAVVAAAAAPGLPARGARVGLHVGCLLLVLLQLAGPRSAFDHLGRAGFYHALEHWSGYPELGLLMAVAACGLAGLACAARPLAVRVGAAALALAFAAGTVFLQSRSAVVTVPVVVVWLLGVAAVKWRSRAAIVLLGLAVAAGAALAVRGGGPGAIAARAAQALERETAIREQGWSAAWGMAAEHPIAGVGLGGYQRAYNDRHLGLDSSHAYNIVLHVLAESGAIGLAGWLVLWARVLWIGVRHAARTPRGAAIFALHGMLAAFLLRSQSEHFLANLATSDRMLLLVALWIGLTEGLARRDE
jgi:O-antigen ligase